MPPPPRAFIAIVAAASLLNGCVGYVPSLSKTPTHGRRITARDAAFIVPGTTTRAEVIKTLGHTYRESYHDPALAYAWEMPAGSAWWLLMSREMAGGEVYHFESWHGLFVAFDARGVVTRKEFMHLKGKVSLDDQLEKWAAAASRKGT